MSVRRGRLFPTWWLHRGPRVWALLPLTGLFRALVALRRGAFALGLRRVVRLPVPVIVIGNILVGGTGKTPLVLWTVLRLRSLGRRPGIVLRGYGGESRDWPRRVGPDADARALGDEPVLLARRSGCPVAAGPDRVAAARLLLADGECDVIVADDGLQHYRLGRDAEIAVIDAARGLGNGHCLPAGPLREPPSRLRGCDLVVASGGPHPLAACHFSLRMTAARPLVGDAAECPLGDFAGEPVHAIAGIGRPERFFEALRALGLAVIAHPFPDHHCFAPDDIRFDDRLPVLMTEKDAVKCTPIADRRHWLVPAEAQLGEAARAALDAVLERALASAATLPAGGCR
jgi:tetraacyldisaccharide 4'-kinase